MALDEGLSAAKSLNFRMVQPQQHYDVSSWLSYDMVSK